MKADYFITGHNLKKYKGELKVESLDYKRISIHIFRDCKLLAKESSGVFTIKPNFTIEQLYDGVAHEAFEILCCPECFDRKYHDWFIAHMEKMNGKSFQEDVERRVKIRLGLITFEDGK
jgi:hypothetical protein